MRVRGKEEKEQKNQRKKIKRKRIKKRIKLRSVLLNKYYGLCNNIVKGLLF
jgi:hypothetical protein